MGEKIKDGARDIPLENTVVDKLLKRGWHIAFAESCTGGAAAARLINVPSASGVIDASHVTYSNDAKIKYTNVQISTLEKHGAVSEQVASEMAEGVALKNNAEVGVGISGIAGPTGGSEKKPVGTVCFGFFINGKTFTFTEHFGDLGRNTVRAVSVDFVFRKLNELVSEEG